MKKCGVCKKKFTSVKTIILLGTKGGVMTVKLCKNDYEKAEGKIGKDVLEFITVKESSG